jgi:hypothetical protein
MPCVTSVQIANGRLLFLEAVNMRLLAKNRKPMLAQLHRGGEAPLQAKVTSLGCLLLCCTLALLRSLSASADINGWPRTAPADLLLRMGLALMGATSKVWKRRSGHHCCLPRWKMSTSAQLSTCCNPASKHDQPADSQACHWAGQHASRPLASFGQPGF